MATAAGQPHACAPRGGVPRAMLPGGGGVASRTSTEEKGGGTAAPFFGVDVADLGYRLRNLHGSGEEEVQRVVMEDYGREDEAAPRAFFGPTCCASLRFDAVPSAALLPFPAWLRSPPADARTSSGCRDPHLRPADRAFHWPLAPSGLLISMFPADLEQHNRRVH